MTKLLKHRCRIDCMVVNLEASLLYLIGTMNKGYWGTQYDWTEIKRTIRYLLSDLSK